MRELKYHQNYDCNVETIFEQVFFHPEFQTSILKNRGDLNIHISKWFYSDTKQECRLSQLYNEALGHKRKVDKLELETEMDTINKAPALITKTLNLTPTIHLKMKSEMEILWNDNGTEANDSHDSVLLQQFTMKTKLDFGGYLSESIIALMQWDVERLDQNSTSITLKIYMEFKTALWGITGVVESFIEADCRRNFDNWMDVAQDWIDQYNAQDQEYEIVSESGWDSSDDVSSVASYPSSVVSNAMSVTSTSSGDSFYSMESTKPRRRGPSSVSSRTSSGGRAKKVSIQEPASAALERSVALSDLKQDLREVRALVSKTEVRVESIEKEFANHELDVILRMYLQKVESAYKSQNEEIKLLKSIADRTPVQQQKQQQQQQQQKRSTLFNLPFNPWLWFGFGAIASTTFSLVLWPLLLALLRRRAQKKA